MFLYRSSTLGTGWPNGFPRPALMTAMSGLSASRNGCELDVALPWCGTFRMRIGRARERRCDRPLHFPADVTGEDERHAAVANLEDL